MARWASDDSAIPERIARFVPSEWPGEDPAGQWGEQARQWLDDHPGRTLPLAADRLEVRQWVVALRASLAEAGHPTPGPRARGWTEREDEDGAWHD